MKITPVVLVAAIAVSPISSAAAQPARGSGSGGTPLLPAPHPLITEVLYDVPRGDDGDADGDGSRSATGDEFIELVNPHKDAINLKGYTLHDVSRGKKGSMQFTFPDATLKPGQVVVVFNGFESKLAGAVGEAEKPPASGHDRFNGALVFSMKLDSQRAALGNAGDILVLEDPDGKPVQVIWWGKVEGEKPKGLLNEEVKDVTAQAAARADVSSPLVAHGKVGRGLFSPGVFPPAPKEPRDTDESKPATDAEGGSAKGKGRSQPKRGG
jgi:hypothetical protein